MFIRLITNKMKPDFGPPVDSCAEVEDVSARAAAPQRILLRNLSCSGAKPPSTSTPVYVPLSMRR